MILSYWNIRGYNDLVKHDTIKRHVKQNRVDVFVLLETRVREGKCSMILYKWRDWKSDGNTLESRFIKKKPLESRNGRIWLFLEAKNKTQNYQEDKLVVTLSDRC